MAGTLPKMREDNSEIIPYNFKSYPVFIGVERLSDHPGSKMINHWHDELELIIPIHGHMYYNINGQMVALNENAGVFVNSQQIHYGYSDKGADCEFIYVLWSPILLCGTTTIEKHFVKPLLESNNLSFIRLNKTVPWMNQVLEQTTELLDYGTSAKKIMQIQSILYHIWQLLYDNTTEARADTSPANLRLSIMKSMLEFIHRNYCEKIYLEDIAAAGNVSASTCSTLFKKYQKVSPIKYLNTYRLTTSCEMLKETDNAITDIAYDTGFSTPSYYVEAFKKEYNMTPSEFRHKYQPELTEFEIDF